MAHSLSLGDVNHLKSTNEKQRESGGGERSIDLFPLKEAQMNLLKWNCWVVVVLLFFPFKSYTEWSV